MKKLNPYIKIILIFVSSAILYSCTAPTYLTNWRDATYTKQFKKILVVALIKDLEFRKAYEQNVTYALKEDRVTASISLNLLPYSEEVSKADLDRLVTDGKYDGLLIMKYEGTKTTDVVYNSSYYDYYWNWYSGYPGYIERHKTVKMETILFSVEKKKPVWAGQTKTTNAWSADELAQSVADEIVANLKEEKLIK
jgi:hypothetical protein